MKPVTKVFLIIGALVLCLLVWVFVLGGGGVIETAYNAVRDTVNDIYTSVGGVGELLPEWDIGDDNPDLNEANEF